MASNFSLERNSDPQKINPLHRAFEVSLLVLMIGILLTIHGALPVINAPNLSVQSVMIGEARCLADNGLASLVCGKIGYPVGYNLLVMGFPVTIVMGFLYKYLSIPLVDGIQLINSLFLVLGFLTFYSFLKKQTSSKVAACVAAFAFYSSAFIIGMKGFSTLYMAFLLFPVYIFGSIYLFTQFVKNLKPIKPLILLVCAFSQFLLLSHSILLSAYSYVMAMVVVALILLGLFAHPDNRVRYKTYLAALVIWAGLLVLPGVLYKLLIFTDSSMFGSSMDFMRGESIDVATLFIPTQRYLLSSWLGIGPAAWNGYAFYGDGSNANYNFLGIFTILSMIIGVIIILRNSSIKRLMGFIALVVLGVGFIFSIGPSLKIYDVRPEKEQAQVIYNDYLMPASEATFSLPTSILFKLPVISTMRSVYRWQLIYRFALIFFIAIFLSRIFRKKIVFGVLLSLLYLLENFPATAFTSQSMFTSNRNQEKLFTTNVVEKLIPYIKENDRVLFLPAANDYLLGLIIPFTGGNSYNVFFDKELTRILSLLPEPIVAARTSFNDGSLTSTNVCELFNQGLVDVVVFNDYSMRWDSYSWPPPTATIEGYRLKVESLKLATISDLDIAKSDFFEVITPRHNPPLDCK